MSWATPLQCVRGYCHATELIYTRITRVRCPKNKHFYKYEERLQLVEFAQLANDRCEVKEGGERRLHSRRRTPQHLAPRGLKKKTTL